MICLKCPFCFYDESKVVDSRSTDDNTTIRRRRECSSCENFNREKIVNGLIIACQKRPISRKQIEELAEDIEKNISNNMLTEVESSVIGEMVMDRLKNLDEVSYVRFASVYREFKDITTFIEEINVLRTNNK